MEMFPFLSINKSFKRTATVQVCSGQLKENRAQSSSAYALGQLEGLHSSDSLTLGREAK